LAQLTYNEKNKLEKNLNEIKGQMACILRITEAINMNESVEELLSMYADYIFNEMCISTLHFYIQNEENWIQYILCRTGVQEEIIMQEPAKDIHLKTLTEKRKEFVLVSSHKQKPIAYAFVRDEKNSKDRKNFITTLTNIIAVAIENKKLFKRQLEQQRYRKEVELASEVQKMLIPGKIPRSSQIEISAIYKPQLNVGGDYYDFIEKSENKYIFCIADISGKGVGAALLMANFQASLRHAIQQFDNLEDCVEFLNNMLVTLTNSERIITLFLAEYDTKTHQLEYINAGHTPPFLVYQDTIQRLKEGSTILGAFDKLPTVRKGQIKIQNQALLMAYTDGLTDLKNDVGVYFDEYCLNYFLMEHKDADVDTLVKNLTDDMEEFKGHQDYPDDIAIMVIKINPT
jgi:phosphoserine phosphatase RsbU/P